MTTQDCCAAGTLKSGRKYDLAVIGAGSAGFSAAITGAELGANVALIGHGTVGGTCVNVGCVPSKTMIRATETLYQAEAASRFAGIRADGRIIDWRAVVRQKDELVSSLRQAKYSDLLPAYNTIAYREGTARLTPKGVVLDGEPIAARRVIIATGAAPALPAISGIETVPYLTSTSALELEQLPASLLVIGGGYIGCELGQMFARAGVKVIIAARRRLLPEAEPEISDALAQYFTEEGLIIRDGLTYRQIEQTPEGVALSVLIDGRAETMTAERVLVTSGRRPNTDGFGFREAGIALLPNGGIEVDDRMRTSKIGVYAAGDVTGRDQFVYMAAYGARIAAENALNGNSKRYDSSAMPAVVFTDPQVASVGLTESEARAQGIAVKTSTLKLSHVPRALAARDTRGLIKLVAEAKSGRILGAHIIAPEGGDSIQTAALAINVGLTVGQLAQTIFPYLTTVEGLKLAAQTFAKDVAKLSCCA
ncbi:MAG: mercury(II) reductase [Hyphomicrobiales bacterium]|nr:mercury(II) reductase [Hyphomicrobiales bacterium]